MQDLCNFLLFKNLKPLTNTDPYGIIIISLTQIETLSVKLTLLLVSLHGTKGAPAEVQNIITDQLFSEV